MACGSVRRIRATNIGRRQEGVARARGAGSLYTEAVQRGSRYVLAVRTVAYPESLLRPLRGKSLAATVAALILSACHLG
jgi:hypothetical protein